MLRYSSLRCEKLLNKYLFLLFNNFAMLKSKREEKKTTKLPKTHLLGLLKFMNIPIKIYVQKN